MVFAITIGVGLGQWVLEEGSQRYRHLVMRQTSTRDVMYNMTNIINMTGCNTRKLLRVNPKSSYCKKKNFFSISLILYLYEMMNVQEAYCDNHFRTYITIVLYTLNLCSAVGQLHCNKTVPNSKNK